MDWIEQQDRAQRLQDGTLSDHWEEEDEILRLMSLPPSMLQRDNGRIRGLHPTP